MDLLETLITNMNKEEARAYKLFATRTGSPDERKDILLFDKLRKNPEITIEDISRKIIPGISPNAYYRLRNRLLTDLAKTQVLLHADASAGLRATYLLLVSRIYFYRKLPRIGTYYLKKAEKEASAAMQFELLDLIYADLVSTGAEMLGVNPDEYIRKRRENLIELQRIRQTEETLAMVRYRLRITQNFSGTDGNILNLLGKTINEFAGDKSLKNHPKLQLQVYTIVSQFLLQKKDYKSLETYLHDTWQKLKNTGIFNKETHQVKLQMLTYLANAAFKNEHFTQSLDYAAELRKAMDEFDGLHAAQYTLFYNNIQVINYSRTNPDKAIEILESLKTSKFPPGQDYYLVFVYLNLAVLWFDKGDGRKGLKQLQKLYLLDQYKQADAGLRLKIAIAELIMRCGLPDEEVLEYRFLQVNKEFTAEIKKKEHQKDKDLLRIIALKAMPSADQNRKSFISRCESFLRTYQAQEDKDSEVIAYVPWVESLLGKKS